MSEQSLRRIRDLPGPAGIPILGNALQFRGEGLHQAAERWCREFGEVYRFRVGPRHFVVFSNPDAVAGILRDRPEGFQRTAKLERIARDFGFSGLFSSNGQDWKRQRSMVLGGLDPTHVRAFFPTLRKVTERFAARWRRLAGEERGIDLQADLMRYTVDVTAGLAFGSDINTIESETEVIQTHLDKVMPAIFERLMAPIPYWRLVRLPRDRALDRHLTALREAVDGFIAQARERLAKHPEREERPENLIEAMVSARNRKDGGGDGALTDMDVSGNVLTMLLAGEDTTANSLAWCLWLLSRNAKARERIASEIRGVLGSARGIERHEQLAGFPYLDACIQESMRMKPVVPILVQQAARDSVVAGVRLPAGALVMCMMRTPAMDARNFPEPLAFLPERWLGDDAAASGARSPKRVSMPFGAGPRICPGRYLALAEMKMVLAMVFGEFDLREVRSTAGAEVPERLTLTMSPVGLRMFLQPRSGQGETGASSPEAVAG